ncbi:Golgi transport complex subunit 3 [Rhodosporidiobolus nylandii]
MASTKASTSRFSLDDWEDLAPLSAAETASVARVAAKAGVRALPKQLARQQDATPINLPTSRLQNGLPFSRVPSASSTPRPPLADPSSSPSDPLAALLASGPIDTAQQFHDFHLLVESSLEAAHEGAYHSYLTLLNSHLSTCTVLLGSLDDSLALLSELSANHLYVAENSAALQSACEALLDEQQHLQEVAQALSERLEYFRELERSVRLLNEPGEKVVERPEFLEGLDRVGVCLEYLRANPDFLDAPLYLLRFQQCLTRSMTLIKMYFVSRIKEVWGEVQGKLQGAGVGGGKDLSEPALHALLYAKFSALSPSLRILIRELEARSTSSSTTSSTALSRAPSSASSSAPPSSEEDYTSLLQACHASYFACRLSLLGPLVAEEVRRMDPAKAELVGLAKAGVGYLRGVAMHEWELAGGVQFLLTLFDNLYDVLRPRILHEPSLQLLVDLCAVLTSLMSLDTSSAPGGSASDDDDDPDLSAAADPDDDDESSTGLGTLRFGALIQPILQDAQTRLVFRAQAVVLSEVGSYVPAAGELDYPALLLEGGRGEMGSEEGWYKTVRRTRWVLERLRGWVNNAIYIDFASEALSLCRASLLSASQTIAAAGEEKVPDGQLFLIRHLLILKELVGQLGEGMELVRKERGIEVGSVTETLSALLRTTSSAIFNPRGLLSALPQLVGGAGEERMVDAKMDLDTSLKTACESFILSSSRALTAPLQSFLDRCTSHLASPAPSPLTEQDWASPDEVLRLHGGWQERVEADVKQCAGRMRTYLREEKTVGVLVPPLLDDVVETYTTFYNLIRSEYGFATSSSLVAPKEVGEKLKAAAAA